MHAFITNLPSLSALSINMKKTFSCEGTKKLEALRSKSQERFWASWFLKGDEVVKIKIHFVKERRGKGLKERSILRYCRSKGSSFVKFKDLWTSKCNISVNKLCQNRNLESLSQIIFAGNIDFRIQLLQQNIREQYFLALFWESDSQILGTVSAATRAISFKVILNFPELQLQLCQ